MFNSVDNINYFDNFSLQEDDLVDFGGIVYVDESNNAENNTRKSCQKTDSQNQCFVVYNNVLKVYLIS